MKSALVTYLYSNAKKYFSQLLMSIKYQTVNDFDFLIFSDGVLENEINWHGIRHTLILIEGSPIEIRIKSLSILYGMNYETLVFTDADDTLSFNRVEFSNNLLRTYGLVCNDLNIIDEKGTLKEKCIWQERLNDGFEFKEDFLFDKNVVGFGNSAIRKDLLEFRINFPSNNIVAADWYVFYQLIKLSGILACFSTKMQTNYRQHDLNEAGIRILTRESVKFSLEVKKSHYQALLDENYQIFLEEKSKIEKILNDDSIFINNEMIPKHLFWWEETNFIAVSKK